MPFAASVRATAARDETAGPSLRAERGGAGLAC
jgi:hypothetical protein